MATSSGNSMTTSEGCEQQGGGVMMMDERKRKRMESNRESARRSRMRKQKHLDDLMSQVEQLRRENNQILETINLTTQQFVNVEAENSVLQAQMNELTQRLQSLNDIVNYMNTLNGVGGVNVNSSFEEEEFHVGDYGFVNGYFGNFTQNNPWNLGYFNQPIMASADVLQY